MESSILIYDDNCPLCKWYSDLFVKYGFLKTEERKAFSTIDMYLLQQIDFDKSRNEIPLLNTRTGNVLYGIDALLEILDQKIPFIKKVGNIQPIKYVLKNTYKLISYNRKVIVARKCGHGSIDCSPDMNYFNRTLFLLLGFLTNTIMLIPIHNNLLVDLSYCHISLREMFIAHFTFATLNCVLSFTIMKQKAYEYLGQVNMLALSEICILSCIMLIDFLHLPVWIISFCLVAAAAFLFKEYVRRMEFAGIIPNYKWIISLNLLCINGFIIYAFH